MNRIRQLLLAVGALLVGVTLLALTVPGVGDLFPVATAVEQLGGDYVFVAVFGGVAAVLLLAGLAWRGVNGLNQSTPPTPEDVQTVPLFGSDFDDVVDRRLAIRDRFFADRSERVRERVRAAAVEAEVAAGRSRGDAERRVAEGTWTDDLEAAAFLSDDSGPSPPIAGRIRAAARGRAWYQRGARRAAEAVVARAPTEGSR
jgi:hypothetical protein